MATFEGRPLLVKAACNKCGRAYDAVISTAGVALTHNQETWYHVAPDIGATLSNPYRLGECPACQSLDRWSTQQTQTAAAQWTEEQIVTVLLMDLVIDPALALGTALLAVSSGQISEEVYDALCYQHETGGVDMPHLIKIHDKFCQAWLRDLLLAPDHVAQQCCNWMNQLPCTLWPDVYEELYCLTWASQQNKVPVPCQV